MGLTITQSLNEASGVSYPGGLESAYAEFTAGSRPMKVASLVGILELPALAEFGKANTYGNENIQNANISTP